MAISRSQMRRQLSNRGGITNLSPRQNFGLGSKFKKFVRKVIPNEVSKVASVAAPFVAPFNPALAGAMAGIGSFDQTGSLSDAFKSGALTYGGGQLARYVGGAGFQGNPFEAGGAFTRSGFTSGFSSPFGTETGLGKFFDKPGAPIKEVKPLGYEGSEAALTGGSPVIEASEVALTGGSPVIEASEVALTGNAKDTVKSNVFKQMLENPSIENIGRSAVEGAKKLGKAIFYDKDGNLDKNVLLGTIAFTASYAEAKALADDVGVELTEAEYDEATKAEKKEQYAADLQNFFSGRKEGGRIGFAEGSEDEELQKILATDMTISKSPSDPRNMTTRDLIAMVQSGRSTPEIFEELILRGYTGVDSIMIDEIGGKKLDEPKKVYSFKPGGETGVMEDFLFRFREENPETYGEYTRPKFLGFSNKPSDEMMAAPPEGRANGGRIGYANGSMSDKKYAAFMNQVKLLMANGMAEEDAMLSAAESIYMGKGFADGGRIGFSNGTKDPFAEGVMQMYVSDEMGALPKIMKEGEGGVLPSDMGTLSREDFETEEDYKRYLEVLQKMKQRDMRANGGRQGFFAGTLLKEGAKKLGKIVFSPKEKTFLFKNLAALGGSDRSFTMPNLFKILKDPSKFPRDAKALKAFIELRMKKASGGIMDIPVRTNKAGVQELDMRSTGGFVPIGVKEKADDVPAMLSRNEFVLTADAVRGIGGGSVEKGSEKLYNLMKQAEQVGRA